MQMKRDAGASTYYALIILMYLFENSDSENRLTLQAIKEGIEDDPRHNLTPSIDTINKVVRHLKNFGFDIKPLRRNNKNPGSFLDTRYFEEWEIKLFADAVLNSKSLDLSTSEKLITKLLAYLGPSFLKQKEDYYKFFKYSHRSPSLTASANLKAIQQAIRLKKKVTYNLPEQKEHELIFNKTKVSVYEVITINNKMHVVLSEKNTDNEFEFKIVTLNEITNVEVFPENQTPPALIKGFTGYENAIKKIIDHPLLYRETLTNYYIFSFDTVRERSYLARTFGENFIFEEKDKKMYAHFFSKHKLKVEDLLGAVTKKITLIYPLDLALELQTTVRAMHEFYRDLDVTQMTIPDLKINTQEINDND